MTRRILYPTDLSSSAEHAYGYAVQLAGALDAELHVLHVVIPDLEDLVEEARHERLTPSDPPAGVSVVTAIRAGESASGEILAYAEAEGVDLIVMGTRGRTGLGRLLLGSVAEIVVRESTCPVITVPTRAPSMATQRVLAAIDFSDYSRTTLAHAAAMAELFDAPLDVIHVLQEVVVPSAYGPEIGPIVTPALEQRTASALAAMVREIVPPEIESTSTVVVGYPATEILRFAEEQECGLIVLATHGLSGLQHFLIGSVTEKVVRKASCPVLTVRSFGSSLVSQD